MFSSNLSFLLTRPDTRPQMRPALLSRFIGRASVRAHVFVYVCACACVCMCVRVFLSECFSLSLVIAALLTRFGRTMGRMHCDSEPLKIGTLVMSHSLIRSLVRLHRSLTRLLHTARFILLASLARCYVRSLARSLSFPSSWDNGIFLSNFQCVLNHSGMTMK